MDRRHFLAASAGAASVTALAASSPEPRARATAPANVGTLLNRPRATWVMRRARLDALLVASPLNVYYSTNAVPVLSRFSAESSAFALVPADPARPIAYITDGFEYYAGASDSDLAQGVTPYLAGGGFSASDPHANPAFARGGDYAFDAREQRRRQRLDKAAPFLESVPKAAGKALEDLGLSRGRIGVDGTQAAALLALGAPRASAHPADDLMLHVRSVKTPAELQLLRTASANNVDAAIAAARAAREVDGIWALRQRFYAEAASRGNVGVYGSIDLVMSELADGTFREGQAFMIDFVSHYGFYQGDYGRTVSYGEPDRQMQHAAQVAMQAWHEIREHMKPGIKFSEINSIGRKTVSALGERYTYAFHPHSVGLQHWDHPLRDLEGKPLDPVLEAGMVVSVDCPLLNAGVNGTTHFEDLLVITETGADMLHRETDGWIQV